MSEFDKVIGTVPRKRRAIYTTALSCVALVIAAIAIPMMPEFMTAERGEQIGWLFTLIVVAGPVLAGLLSLAPDADTKAKPELLEKIATEMHVHADLREAIQSSGGGEALLQVEAVKALEIIRRRKALLKIKAASERAAV